MKLERNTYTGVEAQPSARVLWTPHERHTLWAGLTRAIRTPSRVDEDISVAILAATTPLIYGVIEGNRLLEAETVAGAEVGYRALLSPSLYVDAAAFSNRYDNLVDLGPPTTGMRTTDGVRYTALVFPWINGNEGWTRGFEVAPRWQMSAPVRLTGSYSYLGIALDPEPVNTRPVTLPMLEGSTPRHRVVFQALLSLPRGIQIDPIYRFTSERRAPHVASYHAVDLHLGLPLGRGLELSVVGQNLFDPRHPEWARDPGPSVEIRRSVYARLTWRR
jgi:iron complex outermembrane receptor protein